MQNTLVLVPTKLELQLLSDSFVQHYNVRTCGFGLVASGILSTQHISRYQPSRVLLLGIAGSLAEEIEIGSAIRFGSVVCYGIGAGSGREFQTASELGWDPMQTSEAKEDTKSSEKDEILLSEKDEHRLLLSCTSASSGSLDVQNKLAKFPDAVAEDMEGYAVALACHAAKISVQIIRGISNRAGDRDHRQWKIQEAMQTAEKLAKEVLES